MQKMIRIGWKKRSFYLAKMSKETLKPETQASVSSLCNPESPLKNPNSLPKETQQLAMSLR
jgi:hypothetical protein